MALHVGIPSLAHIKMTHTLFPELRAKAVCVTTQEEKGFIEMAVSVQGVVYSR